MILKIRVEEMKDASGDKKRVMFATLVTEIVGMERIDAVSELDNECVLGKEITELMANLLALKKDSLEKKYGPEARKKKKKLKSKKK